MILKRNPKRKHQVVLLLLQIPIESTLFFGSLPPSLFPRKFCCLLTISLFYLSYTLSIFISFMNVVICDQSISQSSQRFRSKHTHTHTHTYRAKQPTTNQPTQQVSNQHFVKNREPKDPAEFLLSPLLR